MLDRLILFFQKQTELFYNSMHRRSQERLTIMVIPHSHEKIFSLHLNWLMILFLSGTLVAVISLASYTYYQRQLMEKELQSIKDLYGVNYKQANALHKETRKLRTLYREINANLLEISILLGLEQTETAIYLTEKETENITRDTLFREVMNRLDMAPGSNYLSSIYTIKSNYFLMDEKATLLDSTANFIRNGIGVYNSMPIGRPFRNFYGLRDSSGYGLRLDPIARNHLEFHTGMDTSGPEGTPIYSTGPGKVVRITYGNTGYGNSVTVEHGYGYRSLYAHLSRVKVQNGQTIKRGTLIGMMGHSGRVTGDHLHYEILMQQSRTDPTPFVCSTDLTTRTCRRENDI